jgi:hypothetical protein
MRYYLISITFLPKDPSHGYDHKRACIHVALPVLGPHYLDHSSSARRSPTYQATRALSRGHAVVSDFNIIDHGDHGFRLEVTYNRAERRVAPPSSALRTSAMIPAEVTPTTAGQRYLKLFCLAHTATNGM